MGNEGIRAEFSSPVVVPELDVAAGFQDLAVLQPRELRSRLALGQAREDGGGADGACDGLRRLNKLRWSCTGTQTRYNFRFINKTQLFFISLYNFLNLSYMTIIKIVIENESMSSDSRTRQHPLFLTH